MIGNWKCSVFMGLIFSVYGFADTISIGSLAILADSPTLGDQELTISNLTGSNCSADYAACTNVNFTNWTLTVNYTSSYYNNGGGPAEPAPFVFMSSDAGRGNILRARRPATYSISTCVAG